ncbi:MAG: glycoside hydrolase family 3 N-terminal domain-containing protein [candidate division KSB1 bacterium]|nr:glycoside hydrolase family 3 N-terminal domain-containing protein [candidate division KSB1 bacterium]
MRNYLLAGLLIFIFNSAGLGQLYKNPDLPVQNRVEDLLQRMNLEQKVGQMCQYARSEVYQNLDEDDFVQLIKEGKVGTFLTITDPRITTRLQKTAVNSQLGIPLLFATDAIHGVAMVSGATVYPTPLTLASSWNEAITEEIARQTAVEMKEIGLHWTFSPNVELSRDPRWGRTGETFGEDPVLVSRLGQAMTRGYQNYPESRVIACAKHYAGGGQPVNGMNFAPMSVSVSQLYNLWLPPFEAQVQAGAGSFMAAHHELNGVPCHVNSWLLMDILRTDWGFDGFVVSDWTDVTRLHELHAVALNKKEAVYQTVLAGLDVNMHGPDFYAPLLELVREGRITESRIDQTCRRILTAKFELGLFESPLVDAKQVKSRLFTPERRELALQAAREGITLLQNKNNLLPLGQDASIMVTGPNAHNQRLLGDWTLEQPEDQVLTVMEGLVSVFGHERVDYVDSGQNLFNPDTAMIRSAIDAASGYDAVVAVVGSNSLRYDYDGRTSGENTDRATLNLLGKQLELVQGLYRNNPNTIVVFINSRPLCEPWIKEHVPAVIEAWEPGCMGGVALAEILNGDVNPSGKLPVSIPYTAGQAVYTYNHKPSHYFRKYVDVPSAPLWSFGQGLHYTTVSYDSVWLDRSTLTANDSVIIRLQLTHQGDQPCDEIVQLYIHDKVSLLTRPVKELYDFKRVSFDGNQTHEIQFTIHGRELGYYNNQAEYVLEAGEFDIMMGSSSRDEDALHCAIELK